MVGIYRTDVSYHSASACVALRRILKELFALLYRQKHTLAGRAADIKAVDTLFNIHINNFLDRIAVDLIVFGVWRKQCCEYAFEF